MWQQHEHAQACRFVKTQSGLHPFCLNKSINIHISWIWNGFKLNFFTHLSNTRFCHMYTFVWWKKMDVNHFKVLQPYMFIHVVIFVIISFLQGFNVVVSYRCSCAFRILCCLFCCSRCCLYYHVLLLDIKLLLFWNCPDFSLGFAIKAKAWEGAT